MAGFEVPAWAVANRDRFLRTRGGACGDRSTNGLKSSAFVARSTHGSEALAESGMVIQRAGSFGILTQARGISPPPPGLTPGAEYFRDARNHPDVLATILDTARVTVGYNPLPAEKVGETMTKEEATKQHERFLSMVHELDSYTEYITLQAVNTRRIENSSNDCQTILSAVANVILGAVGDVGKNLMDGIKDVVKSVADAVTGSSASHNSVYNVSYQNASLPAPTGSRNSDMNPTAALCFSVVGMTKDQNNDGKTTITDTSESFSITAATYRLKTSAIIAYADFLAGSSITPAETFVNAMNGFPV